MIHKTRFSVRAIVTCIFMMIILAGVAQAQSDTPSSDSFDPANPELPQQPPLAPLGEALYQENCSPCHGATGNSDGPVVPQLPAKPPPFADPATVWDKSPAEYFHTTKFGRIENLMPPWQNQLTDEEIWQAAMYAWSLHTDQEAVAAGAAIYESTCAACHGATGAGDGPGADENLSDWQDPALFYPLTQAELAQSLASAHPELVADLNDADQQNLLDHLRTFSYVPPWGAIYQAGEGSLQGVVQIGTAAEGDESSDEDNLAGLDVILTAYLDFSPAATFTTTTDENGTFLFEDLSDSAGMIYVAETRYAEIVYVSDAVELTVDQPARTLDLTVFEPTEDDSGIYIARSNWIIDFEPGFLIMGQILIFGNQLDRTYIGQPVDGLEQPATVVLQLPADATDIEFQGGVLGDRYHQLGNRVYDTVDVPPGQETSQIVMSYRLPVESAEADLAQPFLYAINSLNLLVSDLPDLDIEVTGLEFVEQRELQGISYGLWSGSNLIEPEIQVQLQGVLPPEGLDPRAFVEQENDDGQRTPPPRTTPPLDYRVPLGMGGFVTLLLIGVLIWSNRRPNRLDRTALLEKQKAELMAQIAALDDRREEGLIAEAEWSKQRAQLKVHLLDVANQLG